MGAKLQALRDLQDIEHQIVDIRRQLAQKERLVAGQRKRVETAGAALEAERDEIRRLQMECDEVDVDVKARNGHVSRLREHLNTVRTNKEYAAVLTQLNTEKADVSKLEARELELMARLEERRAAFSAHEQTAAHERRRLEEAQAQLEQARAMFAGQLARLEARRRESAAHVDAPILTLFDRLSERYDGEVLAEVVKPNPRRDEYICNGCHMSLRNEVVNALLVRDEVVHCKSCGRILFMDR